MRPKFDLRHYQQDLITRLYEDTQGHMAVVPMGGGKTIAALTAVRELISDGHIRHALVIAPKRVLSVWLNEVNEWQHTQGMRLTAIRGSKARREKLLKDRGNRDISLVGIENTQWLCAMIGNSPPGDPVFDLLIIDETSRFRNARGKRAKALQRIAKLFKVAWGLTGTPTPNSFTDLYRPLSILTKRKIWGTRYDLWLEERFFSVGYGGYGHELREEWKVRTLAEAARYTSSLDPADMPELPEINVVEHRVHMPPDVRDSYDEMEKKLLTSLVDADGNTIDIEAVNAAVANGKLCQIAQGFIYDENRVSTDLHAEKLAWLKDTVEDMAGSPVIVVYDFGWDLEELLKLFGSDTPYIGSGVSDKKVEQHVVDWNNRKLPVLLVHARAAGHGLNLQHGGSQMIWFCPTWSPEYYEQTIKRIHRPGQKERCFIHVCLAAGTVDEMKRDRVILKMSRQTAFIRHLARKGLQSPPAASGLPVALPAPPLSAALAGPALLESSPP